MESLSDLVKVFGPVGAMALAGCWLLWRHVVYLTKQLIELSKTSTAAMTRLAEKLEKKEDR
jgi:hypothetical protein